MITDIPITSPELKPTKPFEEVFGTCDMTTAEHGVPDASSGDGIIRTEEQCREWAESIGCDLIVATDTQLFIDIDTEAQFDVFKVNLLVLGKHFAVRRTSLTPSKQGLPHRHIVVDLHGAWPLMTRIAMQAALGSDPMRELLSIRRAVNEEENVVIFFEPRAGL
jgi:hypothetical protein